MSKYQLKNENHEILGTYDSATKAVNAAEQYFQCGTQETLPELKKTLRLIDTAIITHAVFSNVQCFIDKVA